MSDTTDLSLKYPIGLFEIPKEFTSDNRKEAINVLRAFPVDLKRMVAGLTSDQLHWRYRPYGWTIQQVIHHCADSHLNCFIRYKLALSEEVPTIKPYFEGLWALMPDVLEAPITSSLSILDGLHERWVKLMESLEAIDWAKTFYHPEKQAEVSLEYSLFFYEWHARHHLAHVKQALEHKGIFKGE